MHQSFFSLGCKALPMTVQICQNLPKSFIHLCFCYSLACGTEIQECGVDIYASTLWIWVRHEACTEVVKPFISFLLTSACLSQCPWKIRWGNAVYAYENISSFCSLSKDELTNERVCVLVRELQVNRSHQKIEWVQQLMFDFLRGASWDCSVILMPMHWNMRKDLHEWWHLQVLSYTLGTIYMHGWLCTSLTCDLIRAWYSCKQLNGSAGNCWTLSLLIIS